MQLLRIIAALFLIVSMTACDNSSNPISSAASGEVITDIAAGGTGGGVPFGGAVRRQSDLEDLVATAWGNGELGIHRGHAPIENVLEAFLGINHDEMHTLMDRGQNLAAVCKTLGFKPENLVKTLTASFAPFIEDAAKNGVITAEEIPVWRERVRAAFHKRVYWEG